MARLTWDNTGERLFEIGVKKGVLYPMGDAGTYETGVAWSGLSNVTESPSGAEPTNLYADDIKYGSIMSAEEFGLTIEAYMYPDEFAACDGQAELDEGVYVSQQTRKKFGFSYVTTIGNDTDGTDHGYKIHLVYGCTASPSEKAHNSINDSPDTDPFSWEVTTDPVSVAGMKPTSHIIIDSTKVTPQVLAAIEDALYGDSSSGTPKLPLPDELQTIISEAAA